MPRNDETLYLRRPLADLADFCIPEHSLHRILLRVAVTAMDLDCLDRRAHRQLRTVQFGDRSLLAEGLLVLGEPCRMKHQMLRRFDFGRHVGELELNSLKIGDRLSELLAQSG